MGILDSISTGLSAVKDYVQPGLDFMSKNKDAIGAIGGLAGSYMDWQSNKTMQKYAKHEMDTRDRVLARAEGREELQEGNISAGFAQGFRDKDKKNPFLLNTPMTGAAGYGATAPISLAAS